MKYILAKAHYSNQPLVGGRAELGERTAPAQVEWKADMSWGMFNSPLEAKREFLEKMQEAIPGASADFINSQFRAIGRGCGYKVMKMELEL